jgi:type II secretory pathway pseudopilin PulG
MELSHQSIKGFNHSSRGQLLVELLLAVALSSIMLPALLVGLLASREGKTQQRQRIEATTLSKEAYDAVRTVREQGWGAVSVDGRYYPVIENNTWSLTLGSESKNGFARYIDVSDVYRDINGAVVTSGGTIDPSTKKVTTTVSWELPYPSSVSSVYYVVRTDNTVYAQTTYGDFSAGTPILTQVTNTAGGEIALAPNTKGQWCQPQLSSVTINLPGTPNAVTAEEGHIYVSTGAQAVSTQDSFAHILVSNDATPTFTLHGKIKGYKTNAVFGETNWGYVATSNDTKEVVIVNLNQFDDAPNKIYHEEGYFNTTTNTGGSSTTDADTVYVLNNRGYVTAGNYLYVFNLDSKSGSRSKIGNRIQFADSGDTAGDIYGKVVGGHTYIYIAIQGSTPEELKIADVTNPSDSNQWKIVGGINIEPNDCSSLESGKAVFVNPAGTRAYISSTNDASFKEFFIIDTSTKSSPTLKGGIATKPPCTNGGGYEAGGMDPEQSVVVSLQENRAILVGKNGEEYQVLNITDEAHPARCGGLQYNTGLYGVAAVKEADGDAYAYIITGDNPRKLRMIQGGPDGPYVEAGTYESSTIDMGHAVTFNRFDAVADVPTNTTIQYQIAVADPVGGSCNTANFVFWGPDGTSNTKFSTSSAIPLHDDGVGYENPGQCLRYRAYLNTTNFMVSPQLLDISFNFSQ